MACALFNGKIYSTILAGSTPVGWVERSETQQIFIGVRLSTKISKQDPRQLLRSWGSVCVPH